MGQKKGSTGNLQGRPKGTPNKVTIELRTRIKFFLDDKFSTVQDDWEKLEPKERILLYEKMLQYVVPKMKESDIKLSIEKLSDVELDIIINKILTDENKN